MTRIFSPPLSRATSRDRRGRSRSARRRLALEILERRALLAGDPTAYLVNLASAVGAGSGVVGDLAYVVGRANADADPDGSVIRFDPAVFSSPQTITLTATLALTGTVGPIAIEGPGTDLLTISGDDAVQVFRVDTGVTASMSGLTIAHGHDASGGGIHNAGNLSIAQVILSENQVFSADGSYTGTGGAIDNRGILTIVDAAFLENGATGRQQGFGGGLGSGGAVYNAGTLSMTGGRFENNHAYGEGGEFGGGGGFGGAIFNSGMLTIADVALDANSARGAGSFVGQGRGDGGAIYNSGTLTLFRSSITGCVAANGDGGGIYSSGVLSLFDVLIAGGGAADGGGVSNSGTATIQGGTISHNQISGATINRYNELSDCSGGGIDNRGSMTIVNVTITGNTAAAPWGETKGRGGGISNSGTLLLDFATIADNTADEGGGLWTSAGPAVTMCGVSLLRNPDGGNVAVGGGGAFRSLGRNLFSDAPGVALDPTDLIDTDPLLGPLADNGGPTWTMALLAGSPAVDAGIAVDGVTADQRGVARPWGAAPDVGAFEADRWPTAFDVPAGTTIVYGTASTAVSGRITAGALVPPGDVAVTLDGVTQAAAIDPTSGAFTSVFATSGLHTSSSPYSVAYHYAGAVGFLAADAAGVLTVAPAPLTVVADDQVAAFGADPPALTARYFGFVNGDDPASLARPATLTTTAVAYSTPGRYPILASGAASPDYAITFVDGALTVAQPTSPHLRRRVAVVTSLYRRALGRSAEPAGLRFWLGRLDAGSRAEDVARRIWSSPEHHAQIRRHAGLGIGRPAMSGGRVDAWQGASRIGR
ncbi:choice-of-anchor Q domain-containing protein [Planctomyces sp. SH-PL62]|uniref:choice-of-anchor Q domain-containing protein n=1 Tax=Planctomyces sp. SH-PL62 TaxID=1636152 RepID=UPI00078CC372|nr:choice-of-anchor Q domain-containing protein [Planctomyces sp. SH-PL62]AMV37877.1 hypothetical protein VT85_10595 [Planctomyces sp. SH-PL62]